MHTIWWCVYYVLFPLRIFLHTANPWYCHVTVTTQWTWVQNYCDIDYYYLQLSTNNHNCSQSIQPFFLGLSQFPLVTDCRLSHHRLLYKLEGSPYHLADHLASSVKSCGHAWCHGRFFSRHCLVMRTCDISVSNVLKFLDIYITIQSDCTGTSTLLTL
jgi:hypothetical protein